MTFWQALYHQRLQFLRNLRNQSLQLLMNCESGNGLEAWRLLVRNEESSSGSTRVAHLTALLRTTFSGKLEIFEEELQRFEGEVKRYSQVYNEALPDSIHQALLKSNAPPEIKTQVEMSDYGSARELREALSGFARIRLHVLDWSMK